MLVVSSREQLIGAVVARRYRLVSCIGSGALGAVFQAQDLETGRTCAVKMLHDGGAEPSAVITTWVNDVLAAKKVAHPHLARYHDVGLADDGSPYLAMDLLDGAPLTSYLKAGVSYDAEHALPIAAAALSAIGEAHARGLVHGDLKATNLFMVRNDAAPPILQVLDLGAGRVLEMQRAIQRSDSAAWRDAKYLSPEQHAGAPATVRDDLWALAVMLYELVTGREPFSESGERPSGVPRVAAELFQAHLSRPHLQGWRGFFANAFVPEAADRFRSAQDVEQALAEVAAALKRMPARAPSITDLSPAVPTYVSQGPLAAQVDVFGPRPRAERHELETTLPGATSELVEPPRERSVWKLVLLVTATAVLAFAAGYAFGHP